MEGKSLSASDACGEEIELINKKPLAIPAAFGERGQNGKSSVKDQLKSFSVWSTESEHKAHLQNRLESTRLTTNLYLIGKERHITERKFQQDLRSMRIRSARLSIPGEGDTQRAGHPRSALSSSRLSARSQNERPLVESAISERTQLSRPKTAPPMLNRTPVPTICILCATVRNMAMKHRRMNVRTLHSTEDLTESFFVSLERRGKLPDVIQSYLEHLPYCVQNRKNVEFADYTAQANISRISSARPETADKLNDDDSNNKISIVKNLEDEMDEIPEADDVKIKVEPPRPKSKIERVSILEDGGGMTITHHDEIGDVTSLRKIPKDSVNWRLYHFLKSQREFNLKCSVPRDIAERNEKWCFEHSSVTLPKRKLSVIPSRRRSHYQKR